MIADVFCNFDRLRKGISSVDRMGDFNWRKPEKEISLSKDKKGCARCQ